jgi:uncharacterized protein
MRDASLPTSLVPGGPLGTKVQQAALRRFAASLLAGDGRYEHLERLLRGDLPLAGASLQRRKLSDQRALLDQLKGSYLVVQGPPGSGKTYRGARLITHLLAQGRTVGITAQSHKVIHNLLAEIERAAAEEALDFNGIKRGDRWESAHVKTSGSIAAVLDPDVTLIAGTAWLFARAGLDGKLDTTRRCGCSASGCRAPLRSGPSISSRVARQPSSSTRWPLRAARTCREGSTS